MKYLSLLLLSLLVLTACKDDEPVIDPIYTEIVFEVEENPEEGQIVGVVPNTSGNSTLELTYMDQIPAGAVDYNPTTREISIANPAIFDFETTPEVFVYIRGRSEKIINEIEITLALTDIYAETDLTITEVAGPETPPFRSPDFSDFLTQVTYKEDQAISIRSEFVEGYSEIVISEVLEERITRLQLLDDDGQGNVKDQTYNVTYESDGDIVALSSDGTFGKFEYLLEYNSDGITLQDQIRKNNGLIQLGFSSGRILYFEDEENIITFEYAADNLRKQVINDSTTVELFYDGKRNPFRDPSFLNLPEVITMVNVIRALNDANIGDGFRGIYRNQGFRNRSNLVTIEVTNPNFGLRNVNYEYEYNSEGYPVSKRILGSPIEVEFIYLE